MVIVRLSDLKESMESEEDEVPERLNDTALDPGLYVLSTPIGNHLDLTLRGDLIPDDNKVLVYFSKRIPFVVKTLDELLGSYVFMSFLKRTSFLTTNSVHLKRCNLF